LKVGVYKLQIFNIFQSGFLIKKNILKAFQTSVHFPSAKEGYSSQLTFILKYKGKGKKTPKRLPITAPNTTFSINF